MLCFSLRCAWWRWRCCVLFSSRVCACVSCEWVVFHYKDRNSLFFPRSVVLEISPGYYLVPATCVLFQTFRSTKTLLADGTCVRLLVRVNTLVDFQSIRMTKSFIAHITLVRLLVRVNTHVASQITRLTKTLLAHIALVRFFVRVNAHVALQSTRLDRKSVV